MFCLFQVPLSRGHSLEVSWLEVISPQENTSIIEKKPKIKVRFLKPVKIDTLLVILDGTDITQLLEVKENEFEYKPFMVLPPGNHVIIVTVYDLEGNQLQKEIQFTTKHSKFFEEMVSENELGVTYENLLKNTDSSEDIPDSKIEANLSSQNRIKKGNWSFNLNTNLRYYDQNTPLSPPLEKGIEVINWLLTGAYSKGKFNFKGDVGDVQITETPYTVPSLSRRGGVFDFRYGNYQLRLFSVRSPQVFGLEGGTGISTSTDDHILGVSGGVKLFQNKVNLKMIYVTGEEPATSFGISSLPGKKKGNVWGFLVTTNFFSSKLKAELEVDFSKYDPDTSDEFEEKSDRAYRFTIGGFLDNYNYEFTYEYLGRDYAVVGQMLEKDKEGFTFTGGANWGVHNLNIMFLRYNDNVRDDELLPRIINSQGSINYSFTKFSEVPINLSVQKSIQESTDEPSGTPPLDLHTDTVSGQISFIKDNLNIGFQTSYSYMNDKTDTNQDQTNIIYSLTTSYYLPTFSISPSFSLNQLKDHLTDVRTDTYTITIDMKKTFLNDKVSFDLSGTYNIVKADDGSVDNRSLNVNLNMAYKLPTYFQGYLTPVIYLRGNYSKTMDDVYSTSDETYQIYLVFSTTLPFSF